MPSLSFNTTQCIHCSAPLPHTIQNTAVNFHPPNYQCPCMTSRTTPIFPSDSIQHPLRLPLFQSALRKPQGAPPPHLLPVHLQLPPPNPNHLPCFLCSLPVNLELNIYDTLPCGHSFHNACISVWLFRNNICPIPACRKTLKKEAIDKVFLTKQKALG